MFENIYLKIVIVCAIVDIISNFYYVVINRFHSFFMIVWTIIGSIYLFRKINLTYYFLKDGYMFLNDDYGKKYIYTCYIEELFFGFFFFMCKILNSYDNLSCILICLLYFITNFKTDTNDSLAILNIIKRNFSLLTIFIVFPFCIVTYHYKQDLTMKLNSYEKSCSFLLDYKTLSKNCSFDNYYEKYCFDKKSYTLDDCNSCNYYTTLNLKSCFNNQCCAIFLNEVSGFGGTIINFDGSNQLGPMLYSFLGNYILFLLINSCFFIILFLIIIGFQIVILIPINLILLLISPFVTLSFFPLYFDPFILYYIYDGNNILFCFK